MKLEQQSKAQQFGKAFGFIIVEIAIYVGVSYLYNWKVGLAYYIGATLYRFINLRNALG